MTAMDMLLRDIIANPDDDDLRLIYADVLTDANRADEAQLIRLQVAAHKLLPPFPTKVSVEYLRGFIEVVSGTLDDVLAELLPIAKQHPIREVRVLDRQPSFVSGGDFYADHYTWWCDRGSKDSTHTLPHAIWSKLEDWALYTPQYEDARDYDSVKAANAALTKAILRYVREV